MISDNNQAPQLPQTDVKCRFFAQYFGTETFCGGDNHIVTNVDWYTIADESYQNSHLKLKQLSKITDEDAEKLQYTLVNVIGLDGLIKENSISLVKEVISNYEQTDCLFMLPSLFTDKARELGYAIDWNNYKVSKQIEFGWVQLV